MRLFAFEVRRAAVIGQAMVPSESFGGLAGQTDWRGSVNRQVELMPAPSKLLLRAGLALVWFAPFFMGYFRFFGGLDGTARVACLERLIGAKNYYVREAMLFVKLVICACVLGNERMMREIHAYDFGKPIRLTIGSRS